MGTRTWSPNPYAIAELLIGKNIDVSDWAGQSKMLGEAYGTDRTVLFDPDGPHPSRFSLFQDIANQGSKPTSLDEVMQLPLVVQARKIYGDEKIAQHFAHKTSNRQAEPGRLGRREKHSTRGRRRIQTNFSLWL